MFDYRKSFYVTHPHVLIREIYQAIKWFIQRGRRGYADCDVWSIDWYLCKWLPAALRQLAKDVQGVPGDLAKINKDGTHDVTEKELQNWRSQIKMMAEGFDARLRLMDLQNMPDSPEYKADEKKSKIGMELFVKRFNSLWD